MTDICYPEGTDWGCAYSEDEIAGLNEEVMERSEALAWMTLQALTGYRLSLCPTLIRPCVLSCGMDTWDTAPVGNGGFFQPYMRGGNWYNACGCTSGCMCGSLEEALLPDEVGRIEAVWMDGVLLDPSAYRVDNGNRLVRTDGESWPTCQDPAIHDPADGGFWVTYYPGVAPNDLLRYAAGVLAAEYYLACSGKECRLPTGVTNINRVGLSIEVEPGTFPGGMTGIPEVDAVIRIYNPFALKARARVLSPDVPTGRIPTWRS
jgi:hypothetical protein